MTSGLFGGVINEQTDRAALLWTRHAPQCGSLSLSRSRKRNLADVCGLQLKKVRYDFERIQRDFAGDDETYQLTSEGSKKEEERGVFTQTPMGVQPLNCSVKRGFCSSYHKKDILTSSSYPGPFLAFRHLFTSDNPRVHPLTGQCSHAFLFGTGSCIAVILLPYIIHSLIREKESELTSQWLLLQK